MPTSEFKQESLGKASFIYYVEATILNIKLTTCKL